MKETVSKGRHELVSEKYFKSIKNEAVKLADIVKEDGFTIPDLAVIAIIMRDTASHVTWSDKND